MIDMLKRGPEYLAISQFYGTRRAKRSQLPLMNHINEGVTVLERIGASYHAMAAFCLHPLFQPDEELRTVGLSYALYTAGLRPAVLTMEYRRVANAHLSHHVKPETGVMLSPLKEVNDMLIADKVQNRKDFDLFHKGTHPRSDRLTEYFAEWLDALGISEERYQELIEGL